MLQNVLVLDGSWSIFGGSRQSCVTLCDANAGVLRSLNRTSLQLHAEEESGKNG